VSTSPSTTVAISQRLAVPCVFAVTVVHRTGWDFVPSSRGHGVVELRGGPPALGGDHQVCERSALDIRELGRRHALGQAQRVDQADRPEVARRLPADALLEVLVAAPEHGARVVEIELDRRGRTDGTRQTADAGLGEGLERGPDGGEQRAHERVVSGLGDDLDLVRAVAAAERGEVIVRLADSEPVELRLDPGHPDRLGLADPAHALLLDDRRDDPLDERVSIAARRCLHQHRRAHVPERVLEHGVVRPVGRGEAFAGHDAPTRTGTEAQPCRGALEHPVGDPPPDAAAVGRGLRVGRRPRLAVEERDRGQERLAVVVRRLLPEADHAELVAVVAAADDRHGAVLVTVAALPRDLELRRVEPLQLRLPDDAALRLLQVGRGDQEARHLERVRARRVPRDDQAESALFPIDVQDGARLVQAVDLGRVERPLRARPLHPDRVPLAGQDLLLLLGLGAGRPGHRQRAQRQGAKEAKASSMAASCAHDELPGYGGAGPV
jgi:hypothetical protein